jgi:hypothetical protein
MKTTADQNWDRMAAALILSRERWRELIRDQDLPPAVRRIAEEMSARITSALKHPGGGKGRNAIRGRIALDGPL